MISRPAHDLNDQWIRSLRGKKNEVIPTRPYLFIREKERTHTGRIADVNTVFLSNTECPFTCLMCDLWKNTLDERVKPGNIPAQIRLALAEMGPAQMIKLYNSGNFFDRRAIPVEDYPEIADLIAGYDTVVVESHPRLVGDLCLKFNEIVNSSLEVAIGLETVHPQVLPLLNKQMDLDDFRQSVKFLSDHDIRSRAFILLRPPFLSEKEGIIWAKKSLDFAFECGVDCCTIIPTRAGNGAMDELEKEGYFSPPLIQSLEEVVKYGVSRGEGRVFADLWDL